MLPYLLLALALIIAGAIARQGLLSSFLHMICVISAGAISFALWEPLGFALLDSTGGFSPYFAGTSFGMTFLLTLLGLRLASDYLVPDNLNFNKTVDWIGASVFALTSSILSVGMIVIAVGMLQFVPDGFGYKGWAREKGTGRPNQTASVGMLPAMVTARFYETLSLGSMSPMINPGPLAKYRPDVDKASWALVRDSYKGTSGNGRTWLQPKSITIPSEGFGYNENLAATSLNPNFPVVDGMYIVTAEVGVTAFDNGNQFTLSASQARLIAVPKSSTSKARTAFPILFGQETRQGAGIFAFDDPSNFVSSVPGKQKLSFQLFFKAADIGAPLEGSKYYLEIKGLRLRLPNVELMEGGFRGASSSAASTTNRPPTGAGVPLTQGTLVFSSDLRIRISYNQRAGLSIDENNKVLSGGGEFPTGGASGGISRGLRVEDFFEPIDTRIAQLSVARGAMIDTEQIKRDGNGASGLALVDSTGQAYLPAGYVKQSPKVTEISFDPTVLLSSINDLPVLPSSGNTTLFLLYRVPVGVTISEVRAGDETIASLNMVVPQPK